MEEAVKDTNMMRRWREGGLRYVGGGDERRKEEEIKMLGVSMKRECSGGEDETMEWRKERR